MDAFTDLPGVQLYTGVGLSEKQTGKDGVPYARFGGLCLETQFFPDAPNHPNFASPILPAGTPWNHTTAYRFYTR